jgi:hypothetical protein
MLSRNDNPYTSFDYNFAVDSVFNNIRAGNSGMVSNEFLLLDGEQFLLLDGTNFLLLGT